MCVGNTNIDDGGDGDDDDCSDDGSDNGPRSYKKKQMIHGIHTFISASVICLATDE